jgi:actin-like ATPase involved in cell morphogenesis
MSNGKGLDIGTNMLVAASLDENGSPIFKMQRDAFYVIYPKTEVNRNSIKTSLDKRGSNYIIDEDGSFIIVGEDALEIAIERNDYAKRPMQKGIISPREKSSLPMLKLLIESIIGKGEEGDKCIYSVPGKPIDSVFDIMYHTEMMGLYIRQMGYEVQPINEAYAVALSELLDDELTGIAISCGAGMTNIVIVHEGDPLVEFSVTRGGDFIDQSVGNALDISPSLVQLEKESGVNLFDPKSKIMEAVTVYYNTVIKYALENMTFELEKRKKELPIFRENVLMVVSGGLTLAQGFEKRVQDTLNHINFPINVSEVRRAASPMTAVANGCLLASQL